MPDDHAVHGPAVPVAGRGDQKLLFDALRPDAVRQLPYVAHVPARIMRVRRQLGDGNVHYGYRHENPPLVGILCHFSLYWNELQFTL